MEIFLDTIVVLRKPDLNIRSSSNALHMFLGFCCPPSGGRPKRQTVSKEPRMPRSFSAIVLSFSLIATIPAVWGQGSVGTLNGTILDQAGAVVPGASVVAVNQATRVEQKTTSTSAGAYTIPYVSS